MKPHGNLFHDIYGQTSQHQIFEINSLPKTVETTGVSYEDVLATTVINKVRPLSLNRNKCGSKSGSKPGGVDKCGSKLVHVGKSPPSSHCCSVWLIYRNSYTNNAPILQSFLWGLTCCYSLSFGSRTMRTTEHSTYWTLVGTCIPDPLRLQQTANHLILH